MFPACQLRRGVMGKQRASEVRVRAGAWGARLRRMGYRFEYQERTSGPINAIWFDRAHGTLWGGSRTTGRTYGIAS